MPDDEPKIVSEERVTGVQSDPDLVLWLVKFGEETAPQDCD